MQLNHTNPTPDVAISAQAFSNMLSERAPKIKYLNDPVHVLNLGAKLCLEDSDVQQDYFLVMEVVQWDQVRYLLSMRTSKHSHTA